MGDNLDSLFLLPRLVLKARKVDLYDAINFVVYAKMPLITTRHGKELVAGFIKLEDRQISPVLMSQRHKDEILSKYDKEIASFRYPVGPSQYQPLLERMVEANEYALPYFFHEHHELKDWRHRAAMFADLHGELAGLVSRKEVALQITDAERTYVMDGSAWMTAETFRNYLERHGVTPWWDDEKNLKSHSRLERFLLSDGVRVSRAELLDSQDIRQLPSYLFGAMLLRRTRVPSGYAQARQPQSDVDSGALAESENEFEASNYKPRKRAETISEPEPPLSSRPPEQSSVVKHHQAKSLKAIGGAIEQVSRAVANETQDKPQDPKPSGLPQDDTMLTRQGVANVMGLKSANSIDNYQNRYPDFPEPHPITKKRSKRAIEAWLELHRDD